MSKIVTIYGGSGFVGRYIARRLARQGWRVRVAVRHPNTAIFVKPYGTVGQVEPVFCNICDDDSVRLVMSGADAVVNCVGTFDARGKNNFDAVQHEGAARIARIAAEENVSRMVHISAIGADPDGTSDYARTKGLGESAVLETMPDAAILRPSVVFGPEDQFFNRFAGMTRISLVLPLIGPDTLFQPVYVDNVAEAAELAVLGQVAPGIYELGGPETASFREWMQVMLDVIRRRRLIVGLPFWMGRMAGRLFGALSFLTAGLAPQMITLDQARQLETDNVVGSDVKTLKDLGIHPIAAQSVLSSYLWRFRPSGQYEVLKESARNLRL
ncbi:MAG: complex I NDUFA9 subunit family protein [Boseongicola sp.]